MQPRRRLYVRRIVSKKTVVMELERRVRMSLQEDGMTGLIVMDITAALEGDEGTCVRYCSFREREDFGLDKLEVIVQGKPCELVPAFFRAAEPHSHRPGCHMLVSFHDQPPKRSRGPLFGGEEMPNTLSMSSTTLLPPSPLVLIAQLSCRLHI